MELSETASLGGWRVRKLTRPAQLSPTHPHLTTEKLLETNKISPPPPLTYLTAALRAGHESPHLYVGDRYQTGEDAVSHSLGVTESPPPFHKSRREQLGV